jgi:hypothetical protein
VVRRSQDAPRLAQREWLGAWEAALLASGLPLVGADADPPRPRLSAGAPLTAGMPAEAELLDIVLTERLPQWQVREALEPRVPEGHRLVGLCDVWLGESPLPARVVAGEYTAVLDLDAASAQAVAVALAEVLGAEALPRERVKGDRRVPYDLRPFVDDLAFSSADPDGGGSHVLTMRLRHSAEKGIGRPEEVLAELGDRLGWSLHPSSVTRSRLVLADDE